MEVQGIAVEQLGFDDDGEHQCHAAGDDVGLAIMDG
ncbi:hypothetical protein BN1047_04773 [Mycolicibacterium neoaurum]|uniref:Uncharacterized protein n=1 Tax=Mycolicibacterium neoaurum TaxID=1795 RepID=A0AAV2WS13_MYCNE|nr:hypothetical protein BN1047_04773 [Mycolicibacterium neoaurum]